MVSDTKSPAAWMPADKPTELSRIKTLTKVILAILTIRIQSKLLLVTELDWNNHICTKHASWDTLGWYWKMGVINIDFSHYDSEFLEIWLVREL